MAELTVRPLLAHRAEVTPPWRWRLLFLPLLMAAVGILIATGAASMGQNARRGMEVLKISRNQEEARARLAEAYLKHESVEKLNELQEAADQANAAKVSPYSEPGRQFTNWDGFRYEEIAIHGYLYHQPWDPPSVRESSTIKLPGMTEPRLKNVVWYPLYPMAGRAVASMLHISVNHGLTIVAQVSLLMAAVIFFLFARRHYYNRLPMPSARTVASLEHAVSGGGEMHRQSIDIVPPGEVFVSRRWDLTAQDTSALWAVAALLYGPCAYFLYANFTESLFVLLLAAFLYCLQGRRWWTAALVGGIASACRSQGVLFGGVLGLVYLLRTTEPNAPKKLAKAFLLGVISEIGLGCYMFYLRHEFGDPLAFMHAQVAWNVGINGQTITHALNPVNGLTNLLGLVMFHQPHEWPRVWEAFCVMWPPIVLLTLGGRFLSFELEAVGWLLWGLPYVSNGLAGNPPAADPWMSMGRFMAVLLPAQIIMGAVFVRFRWAGVPWLALWASGFALFCYLAGTGAWIG